MKETYEQMKQRQKVRFERGLKIIGTATAILFGLLLLAIIFVDKEWARANGAAYIAVLVLFLPLFAAIFWIQGSTVMEMDEYDRFQADKREF